MLELQLLNTILNTRDASALVRFGLMDEAQWLTHKSVYKYTVKHLEEFGELPSINSVIENTDNFEVTEPGESVETLSKKLIERNVKNAQKRFLIDTSQKFGELSAAEIIEVMEEKTQEFRNQSMSQGKNGMDWSNSGAERLAEFERRKKHDFSRRIPFFFQELTEALGEMSGGYYLALQAFTGKGKTWLGLLQALKVNDMGLNCLFESGEMSKPELSFRLDTLKGKFSNRALFTGSLDFQSEEDYKKYLGDFSKGTTKAPLIIKTQEDWSKGLTVAQIEHDIQTHKPDVVIIDQFSLIRHVTNDRDGKGSTSRRLKEMAGKYGIVIVLLYQANGEYEKSKRKSDAEDESLRVLQPPTLKDYSEVIAVIQDVDCLLTFDSTKWKDQQTGNECGKALLFVAKSRAGGEGTELEMNWIPDQGVIETKKATDIF
jgi:replicative DNA helicase